MGDIDFWDGWDEPLDPELEDILMEVRKLVSRGLHQEAIDLADRYLPASKRYAS